MIGKHIQFDLWQVLLVVWIMLILLMGAIPAVAGRPLSQYEPVTIQAGSQEDTLIYLVQDETGPFSAC